MKTDPRIKCLLSVIYFYSFNRCQVELPCPDFDEKCVFSLSVYYLGWAPFEC